MHDSAYLIILKNLEVEIKHNLENSNGVFNFKTNNILIHFNKI